MQVGDAYPIPHENTVVPPTRVDLYADTAKTAAQALLTAAETAWKNDPEYSTETVQKQLEEQRMRAQSLVYFYGNDRVVLDLVRTLILVLVVLLLLSLLWRCVIRRLVQRRPASSSSSSSKTNNLLSIPRASIVLYKKQS